MGTTTSDQLQRALALRRLARQLCALRLHSVHQLADGNTWVGPIASQCHDTLVFHSRLVIDAAEQLVTQASRLEWDGQAAWAGPR